MTDLRTSNHEDGDGRGFQFVSQTYTNDVLTEDVKGTATVGSRRQARRQADRARRARRLPARRDLPTVHLLKMIDAAEAGERVVERDVFDGSDGGDKVYRTTTVIGPARQRCRQRTGAVLGDTRRWPVTVSYFDPDGTGDQTPELHHLLRALGQRVSSDMTMDYGDFALSGQLRQYEALPETKCE